MNNRLQELEWTQLQVEAIDDVLAMVARDRRRVEALLEEAESTSLRQHLQEWLEPTPLPLPPGIVVGTNDPDPQEPAHEQVPDEVCCSLGCWNKTSVSFWDTFQYRPTCVSARYCEAILRHHQTRSRLAYGVSYEWVTEATSAMEGWSNGEWDWEDADHYYQGRTVSCDVQALESLYIRQHRARGMALGRMYRVGLLTEKEEDMNSIFGESAIGPCCLPTVEQVAKAGGQLTYDLIFCAGDLFLNGERRTTLRHHRTAKGKVVISVNAKEEVLEGKVYMDPCMQRLDAIPCGGDFSWKETSRQERLVSYKDCGFSAWKHSSTSLLFVQGLQNCKDATGEVKVIGKRTALFLEPPLHENRFCDSMLEFASDRMENYNSKRSLWMHRHTNLPVEVISRIGAFVSPPPVLYLEAGDLVLDMDWGPCLKQRLHPNNEGIMSKSSIVFRPKKKAA